LLWSQLLEIGLRWKKTQPSSSCSPFFGESRNHISRGPRTRNPRSPRLRSPLSHPISMPVADSTVRISDLCFFAPTLGGESSLHTLQETGATSSRLLRMSSCPYMERCSLLACPNSDCPVSSPLRIPLALTAQITTVTPNALDRLWSAVTGTPQHAKIRAPRTDCISILMGHHAGQLMHMSEVVHGPCRKKF
jgi:hypothetical protein